MKFDVNRAMTSAHEFGFARGTGSDGERRASEVLAGKLEAAGWRVDRTDTQKGCRYSAVVMLLALSLLCQAYLLWRALQWTLPGVSRAGRIGWFLLGFAATAVLLRLVVGRNGPRVARERFAAWRAGPDSRSRVNLIAVRPGDTNPPSRVVILSHLDTPLPVASGEDAFWSFLLVALVGLACGGLPAVWEAWVLVALAMASLFFEARYWLRVGQPSPADNRTGLAVLAELAHAIPSRLDDRVEIRLAAVGGSATGQLGSLTLAEKIRQRDPLRPTLVINIDAPGLGPEVILVGKGVGLDVARQAAADLWIPHRVSRWPIRPLDHRPFNLCQIPGVSLVGDRCGGRIHQASLAATAQLATEIALRWARRQSAPAESQLGESRARSSQNPG